MGAGTRRFESGHRYKSGDLGIRAKWETIAYSLSKTPDALLMPCRLISRIPGFELGDVGAEPTGATNGAYGVMVTRLLVAQKSAGSIPVKHPPGDIVQRIECIATDDKIGV